MVPVVQMHATHIHTHMDAQRVAHPWHGANVVFVAMSDDHCLYLIPPPRQEAGVGQDFLHAQVREAAHPSKRSANGWLGVGGCGVDRIKSREGSMKRVLWKHQAGVNEDVAVAHANQHAVHANLTQTPYWQDPEGRTLTRWGPRERSVWLPLQSGSQMFCAIALYVQATTLASAVGL